MPGPVSATVQETGIEDGCFYNRFNLHDQKAAGGAAGDELCDANVKSGARSSPMRRPNERDDRSLQQRDRARLSVGRAVHREFRSVDRPRLRTGNKGIQSGQLVGVRVARDRHALQLELSMLAVRRIHVCVG